MRFSVRLLANLYCQECSAGPGLASAGQCTLPHYEFLEDSPRQDAKLLWLFQFLNAVISLQQTGSRGAQGGRGICVRRSCVATRVQNPLAGASAARSASVPKERSRTAVLGPETAF